MTVRTPQELDLIMRDNAYPAAQVMRDFYDSITATTGTASGAYTPTVPENWDLEDLSISFTVALDILKNDVLNSGDPLNIEYTPTTSAEWTDVDGTTPDVPISVGGALDQLMHYVVDLRTRVEALENP